MPSKSFWIIVYVLKSFVQYVTVCLVAIQGQASLLNEQRAHLENLVEDLIEDGGVQGPDEFFTR